MANYKLAPEAEADLDRLFDFGIDTFGVDQAIKYMTGIEDRFDNIANKPLMYPAVDHIRQGYRRSVYSAHSIYYRISNSGVEIMRLIHHEDIIQELSADK